MTKQETAGIHHITAIVGHPQENVDFYASVLGLRLVKKTVNFDDPETYHLYFGNDHAAPGTIMTFFPWPKGRKGKIGAGQVGVTTYLVPEGALSFWEERLSHFSIPFEKQVRFNEEELIFHDPHGLALSLVARVGGQTSNWPLSGIDQAFAIKGFGGATLYSLQPDETAKTLEDVMGLRRIGEEGDYIRLQAEAAIGNVVDIKKTVSERGVEGVGTVHHIAWRAQDKGDHAAWQEHVRESGFPTTDIRDRNYFDALYFRETGGILFEIATDTPGFSHDESEETMGEELMLPAQYEQYRKQLEARLIPIEIKGK